MEITIVIIVSFLFAIIMSFLAFKRYKKLNELSEERRNTEMDKLNNRSSLALFFKDILEFFT